MRRILGFQDAYAYYIKKVDIIESVKNDKGQIMRITKYDDTELDKEIERIYGKDVLDNINSTIRFSTEFYRFVTKPSPADADIDVLKLRMKMLYVCNLGLESPFPDLSHTPKDNEKVITTVIYKDGTEKIVKNYDNKTERFIEGYREARIEGIPVNRAMVNKFVENMTKSKHSKALGDGSYTVVFNDGVHDARSFDITVSHPKMGGGAEGAAANIKIEPTNTLDALLGNEEGAFRVYENDQIIVRHNDINDQSIALVSKSNTAVLLIASAKIPKGKLTSVGWEGPADLQIIDNNLVPDGYHEAGIQPTSFWSYMYWAIGNKEIQPFISGRTISIYSLGTNYALQRWERPEIPTVERRNVYTITIDVTPIIYGGTNINIDQHYTDGTGNWVSDLIGANYTQNADGTPKAFLTNNATGLELTAKDINEKMAQPNVNLTPAQQNWLNSLLFGTNTPADNATVRVTVDANNHIVVHRYGTSGDVIIGTIDTREIVFEKFGYPSDRIRFTVGAHSQWKYKGQTLDWRIEAGKPLSKIKLGEFEKWKGTILNIYLSTNIGKGWTFVSAGSKLFPPGEYSVEQYLRTNLEHMQPQDLQKVIEVGYGATGTWKYGSSVVSMTPEAMYRETQAGSYIGPAVALAAKEHLGRGVSINGVVSVDYLVPKENITLENIKKQYAGGTYEFGAKLGPEFKISKMMTFTFGTGYQYTLLPNEFVPTNMPVSVYSVYSTFRYGRWRTELSANFQPTKIGTEKVSGVPGVGSLKAGVIYEIKPWTIKK
ncbi:MAG: hypothetical protein NTY68_02740 [Candidatus Micrarchaeota archaeon]|nr:hypothetical protein [Candidatus Micrarchaeota archaeon]